MLPRSGEYVVFDVETTGLSANGGDRIVEIAAIRIKDTIIIEEFESFVDPERDIPIEAIEVHHITRDMVADAPKASEVLPEFLHFIGGAAVVGHNVRFDINFVGFQSAMMGRRIKDVTPAIDTLKMSRFLLPHLTRHTLAHVASYLGIQINETHRALADVALTVEVFNKLLLLAEDKNINTFKLLHEHFSINKPTFKIQSANQGILF
ncbi:MAG: DNA polymerase III epsilon subunit family exonuclease [Lysobacterales bacterium]|jgi:DNA polymerase III epsilon subunit family exonuclease